MAYDEQEVKSSRVVVETPTARREVTRTERDYAPERNGLSNAAIAAMAILALAVIGLLGLLFWNMQTTSNNANLAAQQPTPQTIIQQPAQPAPIIVQQPAAQQVPIIVNPPGAAPAGGSNPAIVPDDSSIQAAIDRKVQSDPTLSKLDLTVSVMNGKALLVGRVASEQLKNQVEKTILAIKGVKSVDNQITVTNS